MSREADLDQPEALDAAMRLATVISDLPFGLLMARHIDPDATGVGDFEVRWLNGAAASILDGARLRPGVSLGSLRSVVYGRLAGFMHDARRKGRVVTEELDVPSFDGVARLRCIAIPVDDGVLTMFDDITEHHRARDELATAERKLAQLQEWGRVGFWELDIGTGKIYWSTQAYEILRLEDASLRGFLDVVHPDDRELIDHVTDRARSQPGPYRATHRVGTGADTRVLQHNMQSVAGPDGTPTRLLGFLTDVTAEHEIEERLRRASAQQSVGLLAGSIVHSLNNTFSIVRGHTQLAQQALDRGETVDRMHLEAVERAADSARSLTRQLLSIGREHTLEPRRFSPVELLERIGVVAQATLGRHREVVVDPDGVDVDLVADPGGVERLLVDLVINARDALPVGRGRLEIAVRRAVLDEHHELVDEGALAPGLYAELSVTDDGCGMDEATLDRIFEPFFSTKSRDEGSGVGLASANVFARQSGGALLVSSEVDVGTTVVLYLPAIAVHGTGGAPARSRARRVLIAVADSCRAGSLQETFEASRLQTVAADSLGAAITVLQTEPIDLVVSDESIGVALEASPSWQTNIAPDVTPLVIIASSATEHPVGDMAVVLHEPVSDDAVTSIAERLLSPGGR